jgi:hypothetical protein
MLATEKMLDDIKLKINALKRESRQANDIEQE